MELIFTGRGAMLYPKEGNTAAFIEDENNFYLIDCGEDVACKLIELGKLDLDKDYYLMITHTHSDHIGSLGTLQQYLYWCHGKKLKIVISREMGYLKEINDIIKAFGIVEGTYELVTEKMLDNKSTVFNKVRFIPSNHGNVPLESCAIIFDTNEGKVLYTGDIADGKAIEYLISLAEPIDKIYVDTSLNDSSVHLSIHKLRGIIPDYLSHNIYCMHINSDKLFDIIENYGFNVVSTIDMEKNAKKLKK